MNRRIVSSLVLLVCLVLAGPVLAPSTAYADGGTRPSNAPTLTPDHQVSGGAATVDTYAICCHQWQHPNSPGVQYWKVPLDFGDSLTLDYENVTGTYTGVCILAPSTTDFTVGTSDCVADDSTGDSKYSELKFTAPTSGAWFVVIHDNYCCSDEAWAYTLTAKVAHRTSVSLQGPAKSHRGRKITLSGTITPGISTGVAIQRKIGDRQVGDDRKPDDDVHRGVFQEDKAPEGRDVQVPGPVRGSVDLPRLEVACGEGERSAVGQRPWRRMPASSSAYCGDGAHELESDVNTLPS